MGLFKKKEEVPSLPSAPTLPELPKANVAPSKEINVSSGLPTFPSIPKNDKINQEMVKSAVNDSSEEDLNMDIPGLDENEINSPEEFSTIENPAPKNDIIEVPGSVNSASAQEPSFGNSSSFQESLIPDPPKNPGLKKEVVPKPRVVQEEESNEPIFVRIDKFQEAQKDFESIRNKISEIEKTLGKIKEVKSQEEKELEVWSKDVEKLKSRLTEIDSDIFSQL